MKTHSCEPEESCTEGKLLALHTTIICLARALARSGNLNRDLFHKELDQGLKWLLGNDELHASQAFEELLPMLKDV